MSESEEKKAKLELVQNNLEQLQLFLKNADIPGKEALLEHMIGENGILRPVGEALNELLQDPTLRKLLENTPPPGTKKH